MSPRRAAVVAVTMTALSALLAGCAAEGQPTTQSPAASPTPVTSSALPTPDQSLTPDQSPSAELSVSQWFPDQPAGESGVQAEIRAAWETHEITMDEFARNPDLTDLTEIQLVSTGQEATDSVAGIVRLRNNNLIRKGYVIFRDAVIAEPTTDTDGVTTSEINYCFDPAHLQTVDIDTGQPGESVIQPDQTMKVMVLMEQMPDGSWRAALSETELAPC